MKCPYCGAWSSVAETRGSKRRRVCANGHRFSTLEVIDTNYTDRDRQIVAAVLSGKTLSAVAQEFGLTNHSQVSRIMKRDVPGFDARRQGQQISWQKRKKR